MTLAEFCFCLVEHAQYHAFQAREPVAHIGQRRVFVLGALACHRSYQHTRGAASCQSSTPASGSSPGSTWQLGLALPGVPKSSCSPSWGGFYSLNQAANQLNLDRRVAQLQNEGASAVVSFGGQANNELAVSCTDPVKLAAAYESVIKRYSLTTIDLDIEGAAQGDQASLVRRAQAIATLQKGAHAAKSTHMKSAKMKEQGTIGMGSGARSRPGGESVARKPAD